MNELVAEYARTRAHADAAARWSVSACPRETCRYCARYWRPFPGTKLDGHAKCVVPPWFQRWLGSHLTATRTQQKVAAELGVTISVVRAWVAPRRETERHAR